MNLSLEKRSVIGKLKTWIYQLFSETFRWKSKIGYWELHSIRASYNNYNTILESILEKHAPLTKKLYHYLPTTWLLYRQDTLSTKGNEKSWKKWLKSKLAVHKEICKEYKTKLTHLISQSKRELYWERLEKSSSDQKELFKVCKQTSQPHLLVVYTFITHLATRPCWWHGWGVYGKGKKRLGKSLKEIHTHGNTI